MCIRDRNYPAEALGYVCGQGKWQILGHTDKRCREFASVYHTILWAWSRQNRLRHTAYRNCLLYTSNQHVGNCPGVTVDRKDGAIRNHPEATVTDLPGIYSLSPYSNEEIVTRDFLLNNNLSGIINIVDASNIERNLYLTMQLMELGIPMVLSLIHI